MAALGGGVFLMSEVPLYESYLKSGHGFGFDHKQVVGRSFVGI